MNFYSLPDDILRVIYSFDSTYKQHFSQKVVPLIPFHCLRKEEHLLFRAQEMMGHRDELHLIEIYSWNVYDNEITLFLEDTEYGFSSEYNISFVYQKGIARFIELGMKYSESYSSEEQIYDIQTHFVRNILPKLEMYKHNHIVMDDDKEYYYRLNLDISHFPLLSLLSCSSLLKNKAIIYNHRNRECGDCVVGMFVDDQPRFFRNSSVFSDSTKKKLIKRIK